MDTIKCEYCGFILRKSSLEHHQTTDKCIRTREYTEQLRNELLSLRELLEKTVNNYEIQISVLKEKQSECNPKITILENLVYEKQRDYEVLFEEYRKIQDENTFLKNTPSPVYETKPPENTQDKTFIQDDDSQISLLNQKISEQEEIIRKLRDNNQTLLIENAKNEAESATHKYYAVRDNRLVEKILLQPREPGVVFQQVNTESYDTPSSSEKKQKSFSTMSILKFLRFGQKPPESKYLIAD